MHRVGVLSSVLGSGRGGRGEKEEWGKRRKHTEDATEGEGKDKPVISLCGVLL